MLLSLNLCFSLRQVQEMFISKFILILPPNTAGFLLLYVSMLVCMLYECMNACYYVRVNVIFIEHVIEYVIRKACYYARFMLYKCMNAFY